MMNQLASIREAKQPRGDQSKERHLATKDQKDFTPRYDSGDDEATTTKQGPADKSRQTKQAPKP